MDVGARSDRDWMQIALREAELAFEEGESPVGAVVVLDGQVIGRGRNQVERLQDPTAHAEIIAIGAAADCLGSWRLEGATIYVTLEPCLMCAGAILLARLERVVFGASDPRAGACGSVLDVTNQEKSPRTLTVTRGVCREEAEALLHSFFDMRR